MVLKTKKNITQNYNFLRKHYHHLLYGLMFIIVLLIASVSAVLYQVKNRPLPAFFARNGLGQERQLSSFDEPNLLADTLIRWASKGAIAAYTFSFSNYNQQIQLARPYFTSAGWEDYLQGARGLISTLVQNQLIVNSMVAGTPVISNQGDLPDRGYTWRIQIPFLVTYISANTSVKRNFYVLVTIIRVPTTVNPQGIGIDQFVMVPYGGG